ncbi:MAG: DUF885 domain-containing protein [Gemmatimonadota bacterium]
MSAVDDLCRSYLDARRHLDPAEGSGAGAAEHDSRLGSFDAVSMRAHVAAYRALAGAAEEVAVANLQEEIDRTALLDDIRVGIFRFENERPHERNPDYWLSHLFQGLYTLLARPGGHLAERARPALDRLRAAPAFLDSARTTLRQPPAIFIDAALASLGGGGELVVQVAATFGAAAPSLAESLNTAATGTLQALQGFGRALNTDIQPNDDPLAFAIGEEQFGRRLHHEHALSSAAPEIWRYGMHLQQEVEAELVTVGRTIDPTRPWREVAERLRDDSVPGSEVLAFYRAEVDRADEFVRSRAVVTVPDGPVNVVSTPSFLAALVPFAAYDPPPVELPDRVGRFYVTVPSATASAGAKAQRGHCVHEIPSTVVHEAYPGHHLQLLTAHSLASEVRRHLWTPLTVEGWALYCESMMADAGYFGTPEARLFHLINLLWRAIRITLDVGLHTRGMTPLEAVDQLAGRLPMERRNAEAEVRRYCAMPTYQMSYAVGRRELLKLRQDYEARAGATFSPAGFHTDLLSYGGLPISLARWGMGL